MSERVIPDARGDGPPLDVPGHTAHAVAISPSDNESQQYRAGLGNPGKAPLAGMITTLNEL
jgi:hypothetical protein